MSVDRATLSVMWPTRWPATVREIADVTYLACSAAQHYDDEHFTYEIDDLLALPTAEVRGVHVGIVRELLEIAHPDGIAADDVHAVLARCVRGAEWSHDLDVQVVAEVLAGALGVTDVDENGLRHPPLAYLRAALVVIADLAAVTKVTLTDCIASAIDEIERAQTVEMP